MAVQPSPHKCSLLMIKNKGCPAFKPLVYFSSSKLPFKNQSKIQSKNQSRNQSKFAFFIVFLIFSFQSRNQSRNFLKTTILLKKNGFQSQIEFVQKSIVRLNFFNRGAFGWPRFNFNPKQSGMFEKFPRVVYHSCDLSHVDEIIKNGLIPGGWPKSSGRFHNYFITMPPWDANSRKLAGTRAGKPMYVAFDLELLMQQGCRIFRTDEAILFVTSASSQFMILSKGTSITSTALILHTGKNKTTRFPVRIQVRQCSKTVSLLRSTNLVTRCLTAFARM